MERHRKEEMTMMGGGGGLILLLLLGLVVFVLIKVFPDWQDRVGLNNRPENKREDSAEETLRQRFARGEIDAEDYERSLEVLRNGRASERSSAKEV
jgi:putative membrane protein